MKKAQNRKIYIKLHFEDPCLYKSELILKVPEKACRKAFTHGEHKFSNAFFSSRYSQSVILGFEKQIVVNNLRHFITPQLFFSIYEMQVTD